MKKNYRFNENDSRDKEILEFFKICRNETELVKDALIFYKKAIEKKVIFDTNIVDENIWGDIFENSAPLKMVSEDREKVKKRLIKQLSQEAKVQEKENIDKININDEYDNEIM